MLKQPMSKITMTNVATIRYKINNRQFEIACYRNKALNWRNGLEEDLAEVLQIE
jgi:ribosome maturation protein SDO1